MITKKPKRTKEDFISGAKIETLNLKPDKNYLMRLPYHVWASAKRCAVLKDIPLYRYIIQAVQEKNESIEK